MNDRKTFYMLVPGFMDVHVTKDVGIIPYIMQKYLGYKAVYATYKPSDTHISYPSLSFFTEDIEFDYIEPSFYYHPDDILQTVYSSNLIDCCKDMVKYIENNAKKIDVLYVFGIYPFYFDAVERYKELNPAGKVYLKLDANISWINNTQMAAQFVKFLKNCDLITSESIVEYINKKWPVPVHYIPNGYYPLGCEENHLTKIFAFEEKENIILTAGRLGTPQKATNVLLEAFKQAKPHIPDSWRLVLAGSIEESFKPYVEKYLQENPDLNDRITFLGYIQDKKILSEWFRKAKIFSLPSISEASANVFSEAKAHGCYLITSDIDGCRDAALKFELRVNPLDDQDKLKNRQVEYGSLHAVGDSAELAQRMIEACNNQELLKTVCYSTQQDAIDHFDWVRLCKKIDMMLKISV
ncbi:glycosyltransferase family 4 protein [Neobacillus rhizophilus]|uniref:Glycosyltransferase family 4 protein n=1 Tax=Neobacillus rhizophilus TaxID=2833579 RepID=A0A942U144_9BACI|nr:glycosyltransferase family 4 protein [Neobacillus rhizophilus]MBS4212620.1 glycosyltransferase family 4 protein [Neobacillus rhizophilus]